MRRCLRVALVCAATAHAQTPSPQPRSRARTPAPVTEHVARSVDGRVQRPVSRGGDSTGMGPAAATWVTLHRVGKDGAGPLDSVRTDAAGRYHLTWTPSGETSAVYFASATWGGIAYFTAPLRSSSARGDEAEITVFDTTSRAFPVSIKGRHLIIGKADSTDARTVIEVFELSNDSVRTLVATEGASPTPTWSVAIPQAAQEVRVTQGEISPDAFAHTTGRVSVFAPIAPGVKQVAFSYKLPTSSFPIQIRAEHGAVVFEVLLEEPQGSVFGGAFAAVDPVTLESRTFRRFLAQDVQDGVMTTIELPATRASGRNLYIVGLLLAIGFLMLMVLMRAMQRKGRVGAEQVSLVRVRGEVGASNAWQSVTKSRTPDAPMHERLAQEIAALDATFAKHAHPSESMQHAYEARRAELKEALTDALASAGSAR